MLGVIKRNAVVLSMVFTAIILVWVSANLKWGDERWNNIIGVDGNGYYAYLPAIFIYHDLSFGFFDDLSKDENRTDLSYNYRIKIGDKTINKYFAGTALAQLPFFGMGHFTNWLTGNPLDGYSVYYLIFIQVATLFYALLGMYFLMRILRMYKVSEWVNTLVIFSVMFGTSVFHYVVDSPSMSHIYSFAFVNLFVFSFLNFFKKPSIRFLLLAMFAFGMIVLIRPVNGLVILSLPFLSGSSMKLKIGLHYLMKHPLQFVLALFPAFLLIMVQLIIYKIQTGHFLVYSYGKESLDFFNAQMWKFLFSYRKGFFVYTPVFILSLFGSWYFLKKSFFQFISWFAFLAIVVFVLSSWWQWYYGGSFGSRVMIEYYVFFAIPLALLLQKNRYRKVIAVVVVLFIFVCQIQIYQYRYGYLHWSEMNKERYWDNFLRIDKVLNGDEKEW
ncbi:MAG: hypothetical protein DRI89_02185 [Bacteroidetes bacterium]|nr:MAG: hypothetical protein DRI89_02185 [Bacteroidota bacterium]